MVKTLSRARVALLVFAHDVVMAALSFLGSLYLRLGDRLFELPTDFLLLNTAIFTLCAAGVFRVMGLYRGIWRYASMNDLVAITKAVTLAILVFLPLTFLTSRADLIPRSLLVINWLVLMVLVGAPRFAYRLFKDGRLDLLRRNELPKIPTLLVGSGDTAEIFVRAMNHRPQAQYRVVGVLDSHFARVGYHLHGVEVVGTIHDDLRGVIERLEAAGERPQRLVLADDDLQGEEVRRLFETADTLGVAMARLPRITDFRSGKLEDKLEVRPIAIEDLLNRPQATLDRDGMRDLIAGRRVLVTGAGGSIGSELVRQIASFGPEKLLLVDNSEFHLYEIDMEMSVRHPDLPRAALLADVRDKRRIDDVFTQERPELVFHAAALKHVPMVEANPDEGVLTNVIGTRHLADACRAMGVRAMVMISTDKAVNPTSIMGATKRAAESYCQALDVLEADRADGTRYITVRFGNVLGSTGSVVPLFQKQLARGGPLTVTHPDITRYFMTIREAVQLVLQAAVLRVHDQDPGGRLFVLDMGEPVRIQDLARQMIRLAGLRPDFDVKIEYTGLRPGEKLFEELFHGSEALVPTSVKGILLASPRLADHAILSRVLDGLCDTAKAGATEETLGRLLHLVPEYRGDRVVEPAAAKRALTDT